MGNSSRKPQRNRVVPRPSAKVSGVPTEFSAANSIPQDLECPRTLHPQRLFSQRGSMDRLSMSSRLSDLPMPTIQVLGEDLAPVVPNGQLVVEDVENKEISSIFSNQLRRKTIKRIERVDHRLQLIATEEASSAVVANRSKTTRERQQILQALQGHFLFNRLSEESLQLIVQEMSHYSLSPRDIVFKQGNVGHYFYIIATGHVEILVNNRRKEYLAKGKSFGEIALLYDAVRPCTVRTVDRATLWGISRAAFRGALESVNAKLFNANLHFIESVPLLRSLTPSQKERLVSVLLQKEYLAGSEVVKEGDSGDLFYIIKEGTVHCKVGARVVRTMHAGDFFGEQALINQAKRTATIQAITAVTVLSLSREELVQCLGSQLMEIIHSNVQRLALEKSPLFGNLTRLQQERVIQSTQMNEYLPGDVVIRHGHPKGEKMWIVLKGIIVTSGFDKEFQIYDSIGDADMTNLTMIYYTEDYIATEPCLTAEISKQTIEHALGLSVNALSSNNCLLEVLTSIELFKTVPNYKLEKLTAHAQTKTYQPGNTIILQGEDGHELFIVKEGGVDVFKDGEFTRTLGRHRYFGERSIIFNERRTATVKASVRTVCWVIPRTHFSGIIDQGLRKYLVQRIQLQEADAELEELNEICELGRGRLARVSLCTGPGDVVLYALKEFKTKKVHKRHMHWPLVQQKRILTMLDHPMIMKLIKTFKNEDCVYFLLEYVAGVSLFKICQDSPLLGDRQARFYGACLVLILEYLHEKGVVYRDLKPENVLVDQQGYLKLIAFDTAKSVQGRTYTVVGTPHYMAPEVITGEGYGSSVDYWSLGVLLFECIFGRLPFAGDETDPLKIYQLVAESPLVLTEDHPAVPLLKQLLHKVPAMRGDAHTVKNNPWFHNTYWDRLYSKLVKPPYIPDLSDAEAQLYVKRKQTIGKNLRKQASPTSAQWLDEF